MKTIPLILFGAVCLSFADGPIGPPVDDRLLREVRERDAARRAMVIERDPRIPVSKVPSAYRMVGYDIVNLGEIQQWEQLSANHGTAAGARPIRDWLHVTGIVTDNKNGAVKLFNVQVANKAAYRGGSASMGFSTWHPTIWVVDPPEYPLVNRSQVDWFIKANGKYRPDGFPEYVHGKPVTAEQARAALAPPPVRVQTIEELSAQQTKVINYQLTQASNGYPSFQFEIGKRYLNGDGLDANRDLALHWLRSACTNGNEQASNLLVKAQGTLAIGK